MKADLVSKLSIFSSLVFTVWLNLVLMLTASSTSSSLKMSGEKEVSFSNIKSSWVNVISIQPSSSYNCEAGWKLPRRKDRCPSLRNFVRNYLSWSRTILLSFCLSCSVSLVLWENISSNSVSLKRYFHRLKYNFNKTNYRQTTLNTQSVIKQRTNDCKTCWNS